jgi:hypothetical protein
MSNRRYRVVVASSEGGLYVAASGNWTVLKSTIRNFDQLETNDDHSLGDIGAVTVEESGYVALAYQAIE